MSKLESLVPPLELCKLIPAGEFEDSCFVRIGEDTVILRSNVRVVSGRQDDIYPAPTLEEIIRKIRLDLLCGIEHHGDFYVANRYIGCFEDERAATAALKLWQKLKGVEV